ncbi:MAG: kelch repeat-containing protein [Candidatus Thorarchaeota archaeon]
MNWYHVAASLLVVLLISPHISTSNYNNTAAIILSQSDSPQARSLCGMAFDSTNGRVIMFGGGQEGVLYDDTRIYDYSTNCWTELQPLSHPSARNSVSMVYDSANQVMVLFGGHDGNSWLDETWIFDCVTDEWTQLSLDTSPPPRGSAGMVFDSSNNRTILFSGYQKPGDTWVFDYETGNWIEFTPVVSPSGRYGPCITYDKLNERTILFGGNSPEGMKDDLWTYDYTSNTWNELSQTTHPLGRKWGSMVYDSNVSKAILFSGDCNDPEFANDTWILNPTTDSWTERTQSVSPLARSSAGMTYDSLNQKTILFGGWGKDSEGSYIGFAGTWSYDYDTNTWEDMSDSPCIDLTSTTTTDTDVTSTTEITTPTSPNTQSDFTLMILGIGAAAVILIVVVVILKKH